MIQRGDPEAGEAPRLEEMATFVQVVEARGFSAAARELGLSPSAVSKQVRVLEERLGVRLLQRTTRRLALTEPGRRFLERARAILAEVRELRADVAGLQREPRGTLRIAAPPDFGRLQLGRLLAAFAARHPDLGIELELSGRAVDVVEEGFDVAIRIAALRDSSLVARRLAPCRRVLCASPDYLRRRGEPRRPADLERHECIDYAYQAAPGGWRFRVTGRRGGRGRSRTVFPSGRLRLNDGAAMREFVLAGLGIALLPTYIVGDDLREGTLRTVLDEVLDGDIEVMAVYPHRRQLAAKVRLFVDFLAQRFGPAPPWDRGLPAPLP